MVFTADQGLDGGHHGLWGMGDHTRPLCTFDEGMHVPLIFRQPGAIPAGGSSALLVSNYDFLPTLLDYLGLGDRMPRGEPAGPRLLGRAARPAVEWENVVYYEFENSRMIRTDAGNTRRRFPGGPTSCTTWPPTRANARTWSAGRPRRPRSASWPARLDAFFDRYAEPKYDLWRGGRSKSLLLTMPEQGAQPARAKSKPKSQG